MSLNKCNVGLSLLSLGLIGISITALASEPIPIRTCEQLRGIGKKTGLDADYIQVADLDCSDWDFMPIGDYSLAPFSGTYDGNNFVIKGIYIVDDFFIANGVGLFAYLSNATISNVGLIDFYMKGEYDYIGGIAGIAENSEVKNCYVIGKIQATLDPSVMGGLIGKASHVKISNSYTNIDIRGSGGFWIGGLVGILSNSTIENSYALGSVDGRVSIGGLVGEKFGGIIINSYAAASVSGDYGKAGGLVGGGDGDIATVIGSYYNSDLFTIGGAGFLYGEPRTTDQMQLLDVSKPVYEGWDQNIWYFREGYYPDLY